MVSCHCHLYHINMVDIYINLYMHLYLSTSIYIYIHIHILSRILLFIKKIYLNKDGHVLNVLSIPFVKR